MSTLRTTWRAVLAHALLSACLDLPQVPSPPEQGSPQPSGPARVPAASQVVRLGAWNVRKLGFDPEKDLASVARIIEAHFDLIAVIELMWTERGPPLSLLLDQLGPGWSGHVTSSARPNLPSPHAEYYAVLYRPERVAPCAELRELRFIEDADGSAAGGADGLFLREPAFGCYRTSQALGARDFLLGVYHARWGEGRAAEIADEVRHVDAAFEAFARRLPHERELFMIGDFNLTPAALAPLTRAQDRTQGQGSTLNAAGAVSAHLYDHLLAFGAPANAALPADAVVLDVRGEANDPASFRARVSDHLPIVVNLPAAPDAD
jgi:hypothetical protein